MSTKLNITGLMEEAKSTVGPDSDGTYSSTGAMGGTEMMMKGLRDRLPAELLDQFNIIASRVRHIDANKMNIAWLHDTWDDPESKFFEVDDNLNKFKKLVFVSHYQQSTFNMGRGVPFSRGIVMQNAIDPIPKHNKPTDKINLIYHTTPHRGLELLVPVFVKLAETDPRIHLDVYSSFNIYGWGQRDVPYEPLFDICRNHPQITYHGYQSNDIVRQALQKAHIYAYPCIWPETSCISVIEAMSAGCEVVTNNLAALPETCANFATSYVYQEDLQRHANVFYNVLKVALSKLDNENNKRKLDFQKMYYDNFYNWDLRAAQWKSLLEGLAKRP